MAGNFWALRQRMSTRFCLLSLAPCSSVQRWSVLHVTRLNYSTMRWCYSNFLRGSLALAMNPVYDVMVVDQWLGWVRCGNVQLYSPKRQNKQKENICLLAFICRNGIDGGIFCFYAVYVSYAEGSFRLSPLSLLVYLNLAKTRMHGNWNDVYRNVRRICYYTVYFNGRTRTQHPMKCFHSLQSLSRAGVVPEGLFAAVEGYRMMMEVWSVRRDISNICHNNGLY